MPSRPVTRTWTVLVGLGAAAAVVLPAGTAVADPTNSAIVSTPAAVTALRLTPGRVWWAEGNVLKVRDLDTTTSPATVSGTYPDRTVGQVTVGTTTTPVFSPSADRLAYLDPAAAVIHVVDATSGAKVVDVAEATGLTSLKLSGSRLEQDTPTAVFVRDLVSGTQWSFPPSATLSGRYVAYFNADGSITRQDLITGVKTAIRDNTQPTPCAKATVACSPANSPVTVKIRGDWVFWKYSCELAGRNLVTGVRVDLSSSLGCLKKYTLLEGWLAFKDSTGVHARDLTSVTQVDLVGGTVNSYAMENRSLGWTNATGGLHVGTLELPSSYAPSTRLSDASTPPAFSPNADGVLDHWLPIWSVSGDVAWTLNISGPNGPVAGSPFTGGARYGSIEPTWSPDSSVLDGAYTWSLTGTAPDGTALKGTDGKQAGLAGTVVVRRHGLSGSVSAPLVASGLRLSVHLVAASTTLPGYHATGYLLHINDNGVVRTLRTSSATPAIVGAQGHTYRLSVQVLDNAGNTGPVSAVVTTAVPIDDRSAALVYSTGWTSLSSAGSFLGTVRSARAAGAAVSVRTVLRQFAVVVTGCPTCGQFRAYLDGHYLTTVDTYSGVRSVRRIALLRTVATTAGTHTLRLVIVATAGRPSVYLDAVAGIR